MISRESGEVAQWLKALVGKPGAVSSVLEPTQWKEKLRKKGKKKGGRNGEPGCCVWNPG